jgi:aspartyl-tRNA(Asn)/glutamyl-tRNA(Gln) amidotransferase subunit B
VRAAHALQCAVQQESRFDRKHYFYHDQPSGYQITQYYHPFAKDGRVQVTSVDGLPEGEEMEVRIKQMQMEQDTARTHDQDLTTTLVDFNRAGHPLIEIISLPDIHSPQAAAAYMRRVQALLFSVDAVTTGMELGGLRADVNVSVRRTDGDEGVFSYGGVTDQEFEFFQGCRGCHHR